MDNYCQEDHTVLEDILVVALPVLEVAEDSLAMVEGSNQMLEAGHKVHILDLAHNHTLGLVEVVRNHVEVDYNNLVVAAGLLGAAVDVVLLALLAGAHGLVLEAELLEVLQAVVRRLAEEVRAKLVHRGEADASQVHLGLAAEYDRVAVLVHLVLVVDVGQEEVGEEQLVAGFPLVDMNQAAVLPVQYYVKKGQY